MFPYSKSNTQIQKYSAAYYCSTVESSDDIKGVHDPLVPEFSLFFS